RESLRDGLRKKVILAPKVLVKAADSQTGCFHYALDARTAQPFYAKLASGAPNDTLAGSRLVFRFVTHISCFLDYTCNPIDSQFCRGQAPKPQDFRSNAPARARSESA